MLILVIVSWDRLVTSVVIHYLVCGWQLWHFRSSEFNFDEAGGQRSKLDSSGWAKVQPLIWYVCLSITLTTWQSYEACPHRVPRKKWNIACRDGKQEQDILKISPTLQRASKLGLDSCREQNMNFVRDFKILTVIFKRGVYNERFQILIEEEPEKNLPSNFKCIFQQSQNMSSILYYFHL